MSSPHSRKALEEKKETIEELLEQLILDTFICLLTKVSTQNQLLAEHNLSWKCYHADCDQRDDIPF